MKKFWFNKKKREEAEQSIKQEIEEKEIKKLREECRNSRENFKRFVCNCGEKYLNTNMYNYFIKNEPRSMYYWGFPSSLDEAISLKDRIVEYYNDAKEKFQSYVDETPMRKKHFEEFINKPSMFFVVTDPIKLVSRYLFSYEIHKGVLTYDLYSLDGTRTTNIIYNKHEDANDCFFALVKQGSTTEQFSYLNYDIHKMSNEEFENNFISQAIIDAKCKDEKEVTEYDNFLRRLFYNNNG